MSLQTLLEAAKYIELQEQLNSTSSSAASALTIRPPSLSSSSTSSNSSSTSSTDATYHHHNQLHRNSFVNSSNSDHHSRHHNNNNNHSTNLNNNINRTNNSRNSYRNRQHHEQRRGNKRSSTGSTVVASNYPSSASSSPHSPVGPPSQSSNTLLTNGGGSGGGINGVSNHHDVDGGLSVGANGVLGTTTNGISSNHILTAVQGSVVNGYDYDGRHQTSISVGNSANVVNGTTTTTSVVGGVTIGTPINGGLSAVVAAAASVSATDASLHSTKIMTNGVGGGNGNILAISGTEDSSQSSLNLSSSGYQSGSSVNSSVGVSSVSSSNLNTSNNSSPSSLSSVTSATTVGLSNLNGSITSENQLLPGQTSIPISGRRRTTSTNSTGAGTREVHNKLEKHRRAHLKECFESLKKQLDLRDEERKKTSNLAILGAAYRCVMYLKRNERELEQQVEKLAKEKINYQKRIVTLKRELASKHDNIDISSILPDTDIRMMPSERDSPSGSATRYSSSSSLSSGTTVPSPAGSGSGSVPQGIIQKRETSPQVVMPSSTSLLHTTPHSPSNHHHLHHNNQHNHHHIHHPQFPKSISPVAVIGNSVPLSLTTKTMPRGSPTPSTPSPSSSSMNGIPPSSPIISSSGSPSSSSSTSSLSASPPISIQQSPLGSFATSTLSPASVPISLKIQNVPNGMKVPPSGSIISSSTTSSHQHIPPSSSPLLTSTSNLAIISSSTHNSSGLSVASTAPALSAATVLNYTTSETSSSSSILAPAHLSSTTTINSLPLNLNAPANVTILHAGKNGLCRKSNDLIVTTQQQPQHHSSLSVTSSSNTATITTKDKFSENSCDQTPKCINLVPNGIITQQLDQVKPVVSLPQGLVWAIGPVSQPSRSGTSRLLVSTTTPSNGRTSSESAILPGGAEVNVLPQSGNVAIVNNGITFKGADGVGANGHAVHVMTPLQPRLQSLVVPQGLIPSQLSGNVLSVSGRQLPIINTQYLNGMEQMVVVANNPTASTLSSVPNTATSVALATATGNGSIS